MNKRLKQLLLIGIASVLSLSAVVYASSAGSDQDPLVTLSYVEKRIQEVMTGLDTKIEDLKKLVEASGGASEKTIFEVVQAEKGSIIYFGAGTEFVVRSGKATAITAANGGLSDLTDGKDIAMGKPVSSNHHMLVPRDDGRGLNILDKSFVLIKGAYTITQ